MSRKLISTGSPFEEKAAYSRAVIDGDWVFVSGTTGFNYATMEISDAIEEQTEQCLKNISETLAKAGSGLDEVVRVLYIVPVASEFEKCWPVLRRYLGRVRPAATMISAGLADERMKIEIEATALRKKKSC